MKIKELKEFLEEADDNGEVWIQTGVGLSSLAIEVLQLNSIDLHIGCDDSVFGLKLSNLNYNFDENKN